MDMPTESSKIVLYNDLKAVSYFLIEKLTFYVYFMIGEW